MKTTNLILLVLLLLAASAVAQSQSAYTNADGSIYDYSTNADGVSLTITGYAGPPWAVIIPTNMNALTVTNIGTNAFYDLTNLTSIAIPGSVTNIGSYAFGDCPSLTNATINDGTASIGDYAFNGCYRLTGFMIPAGVTSIGEEAFFKCQGLTNMTIPASVTNIGYGPFNYCNSLKAITVDTNNPFYSSTNGVLFDINQSALIEYPGGLAGGFTVPGSVTSIGNNAFSGADVDNVTIPGSVTIIGDNAFSDSRLTSVTIPASVTNIGVNAFYLCQLLTNVMIANGVTSVGGGAFESCRYLASVTIPGSVTNIGNDAFNGCSFLTSITIPGSVANIGDYAFENCIRLTNLTILNGVATIGNYTFQYCTGLTNITIPGSVTNIGTEAFAECSGLASVYFEGNAPTVGAGAFPYCNGCNNATVFYLSDTSGWSSTFASLLTSEVPAQTQYACTTNADGITLTITGYSGSGGSVAIPANINFMRVTGISADAFQNFDSLTDVTIPGVVTNIGDDAFNGCTNLTGVFFDGNAPTVGSSVFSDDTNATIYYFPETGGWSSTFAGLPAVLPLGATASLVGSAAGTNSVVLAVAPQTATWTAVANATWLHLSLANQSGTGSTNLIFSYDANPGATRSGTLSIASQTFTVTQAGSTYMAAQPVTTLVSSGLVYPWGVAVDGAGNVYIADQKANAIKKWTVANNTVSTLVSSGLNEPADVAVDRAGNVYIDDTGNNAIKEWTAANSNVITLVSSGLKEVGGSGANPYGVAVDGAGNVYIDDTGNYAVKKWSPSYNALTTLVSSGLSLSSSGVAVDGAGNVYIADAGNNEIKEWLAANGKVILLPAAGLDYPEGPAVDGAGNVFFADTDHSAVKKWSPANNSVTALVTGLLFPSSAAVDSAGDVYVADTGHAAIKELPYAFVDTTPRLEGLPAGNDVLPVVLPATANLLPPFAPTSDQPWLTITGITNGVVNFSFTADTGASRLAHISLLGQRIIIQQGSATYSLGATARLEGPEAGIDSVVLAVNPFVGSWTATANATWLHLSATNQSGTISTNVVFSFDTNTGGTRIGTLTIGGQTLVVTQAGATYVAAGPLTTLVSSGLNYPVGVAVDSEGNVYIDDRGNFAIKKWKPANNTVTTLFSELSISEGVAVDGLGNLYFTSGPSIQEWTAANGIVTPLVSSGLTEPWGVAVDGAANVYFADVKNNTIKEWTSANSNVTTLVSSGLNQPYGVAVDLAGNVYIADGGNNVIKEWTAGNNTVTTLASSGLSLPVGVAVDGAGDVYFLGSQGIRKWTAASDSVTTLVSSGFTGFPQGFAVDVAGNFYIADPNNAVEELPYAFVDPAAKLETPAAGSDTLPVVLPATANLLPPFAPTSDQPWLTISAITNGVVSFSFTANTAASNRTANIVLLGLTVPITQAAPVIGPLPVLTSVQMLANGVLQFAFTNIPGASFTVVSTTNLSLPLSNWTVVGAASNTVPGMFQFNSQPTTNDPQLYYGVRSP